MVNSKSQGLIQSVVFRKLHHMVKLLNIELYIGAIDLDAWFGIHPQLCLARCMNGWVVCICRIETNCCN